MSPQAAVARGGRPLPRIHVVTDDAVLARDGWQDVATRVLDAGGADVALHLRGARTGPRALLSLATRLSPHARRTGSALLVNDRIDVALVAEVDGVHLGGRSLPPEKARALLGPGAWIGVSRHDAREAADAAREGADYVFLGTIFETVSHPGAPGLGISGLEEAVKSAGRLPILGIGGIGPGRVAEVVGAGAHGVAAIRGIWDARDPVAAVRRYLEGLKY